MKRKIPVVLVLLLAISLISVGCNNTQTASTETENPKVEKVEIANAAYVGSDACISCHGSELVNNFEQTVHSKIFKAEQTCETCHGSASVHVTTSSKAAIAVNTDSCYTCHPYDKSQTSSLSCTSCHDVHSVNNQGKMLNKDDFSCASCHGKDLDPKTDNPHHPKKA